MRFYLDEPRCMDETHNNEKVAWMVIEAGTHVGGSVQAGLTGTADEHDVRCHHLGMNST